MSAAEFHLFIIWENAGHELEAILEILDEDLDLLRVTQVTWSEARFSENLTRFYGENLPRGSFKERECGRGPFHVALVRDPSPEYGEREATSGLCRVNTRCFDAKARCRSLTGGGFLIHGTNNPVEANHDCAMLFGVSIAEHLGPDPAPWDGVINTIARDVSGSDGWANLEDLFRVLNAAARYVVLRNFEGLPHQAGPPGHEDIDLLTDDTTRILHVLGAKRARPEPYRVLHTVRVAGQHLLFDFRCVGDGYYDARWEADILDRRVLDANGFYRPCDEDHFAALLYHATVHKVSVSDEYFRRVSRLGQDLGIAVGAHDVASLRSVLHAWLEDASYEVCEPLDLSVVYNRDYATEASCSPERARHEAALQGGLYLEAIEAAGDLSTQSEDFRTASVTGHPGARLQLSWRRHLPLRALGLPRGGRAVEFSAGCGAVTRYLGERCDSVVAIETNPSLERGARARCAGLAGVKVLTELPAPEPSADLAVSLISEEPRGDALLSEEVLSWLIGSLSDSGVLVLGVPHSGAIVDLGAPDQGELRHPDALDRATLEARLAEHGLEHVLWLTPYPDHLVPSVFFSDEAVARSSRTLGAWAGRERHARHASEASGLLKDLEIYGELGVNRGLSERANGLIAVAARSADALPALDWQVLAFNGERRRTDTQTETRVPAGEPPLSVLKAGNDHHGAWFAFHPTSSTPLFEGELLEAALVRAVETGDRESFFELTRAHCAAVRERFAEPSAEKMPHKTGPGDVHVDGRALDAIYGNFVRTPDGLEVFDLEWSAKTLLPLSFVVFRSLIQLRDVIAPGALAMGLDLEGLGRASTYEEMILLLMSQIGPVHTGLGPGHLKLFHDAEQALQRFAREGVRDDVAPPVLLLQQGIITAQARRDAGMAEAVKRALARFYRS
ncbi:MAG: hypothetical protein CL940_10465 [Deltaproteobacteria bacterium]|nr:hypothetical protein [Deltaproteobacteria bacterium]